MSGVTYTAHLDGHRPKVSVIVPVYNTEKYLARCLDSVVGQTERDLEIICVNDGSTDCSAALLERYAVVDARIRVVTQENGGLSAARNAGLDVATGEFVMFVDSDDWIPLDAVVKMLGAAGESGLPVVVANGCAKDVLPRARAARCRWTVQKPALECFVANRRIHSSAWNKLYRRETIGARRFIPGIYFEDWPFNTELFADIPGFALVDEPMYVYATDGISITRSVFSLKKAESYVAGIGHVAAFFHGRPDEGVASRRIAMAVKMLVSKAEKCGDQKVRALVAAQDFMSYPLDLKTRFRLWRMRRALELDISARLHVWGPELVHRVHDVLTSAGIGYYLDCGTLLGIVRDGGFIPHDTDVDCSVFPGTDPTALYHALTATGFAFKHGFRYEGRITELSFSYHKVNVDFFWSMLEDGNRQSHLVCSRYDKSIRYPHGAKQAMKCYRTRVTGVRPIDFKGSPVSIPINCEELLASGYGPGWRTPDPSFRYDEADNRRVILPGFAQKFRRFPDDCA